MAAPLLTSKYRLPNPRPGAVARRRLAEYQPVVSRPALTLLSAPAGFGKTTLLTEWLAAAATDGAAVGWLSLDRRDNDAALFWTYVVAALQTAVAGVGDRALQLLASSSPPMDAALAALLNDLDGLSTDLVLVLDDYHVIDAPEVHAGVTFVLEHQPAKLHLVLATRGRPAIPPGTHAGTRSAGRGAGR